MIPVLVAMFITAAACELAGVVILVREIQADASDLRTHLDRSQVASAATATRTTSADGRIVRELRGGPFAPVAATVARSAALEEFVTARLSSSFTRRWVAVGLLAGGIVIGLAANLLSLAA